MTMFEFFDQENGDTDTEEIELWKVQYISDKLIETMVDIDDRGLPYTVAELLLALDRVLTREKQHHDILRSNGGEED